VQTFNRQLLAAIRMLIVLTVILGVAYPLVVWGIGRVAFPSRSQGSLIERDGVTVGSSLIAQDFAGAQWFHPRPSASAGHDPLATGGSNLGPNSTDLITLLDQRRRSIAEQDSVPGHPVSPAQVPADAITASFSGVDPYISPENARLQIPRVALARKLSPGTVTALVRANTSGPQLGYVGIRKVNVVELNAALGNGR
jgi:K+-transporting ATPase ATPase C chain